MVSNVQKIAKDIVALKSGYVNDPDDPGGVTKHGVSIHVTSGTVVRLNFEQVRMEFVANFHGVQVRLTAQRCLR